MALKKWAVLQVVNGKPDHIYENGYSTKAEIIEAIQNWKLEDIEHGWEPGEIKYYIVDGTEY